MKISHLPLLGLILSSLHVNAQVSENFDKTTLSSGSLACWGSEYTSEFFTTARVAAASSLSSDSRLSLNTASPITGTASLRLTESITVPVYRGASSTETITTPALGSDGNTVSFKVRLNAASFLSTNQFLYVMVICGDFRDYIQLTASNIGSLTTISSTISNSNGGGKVQISFWYNNYAYFTSPTTLSYSLDVDDFTTTAPIDPANTCMNALPVTLTSFSASKTENMVKLDWATTQETGSDRFEILRSPDAKLWTQIGTQLSAGENSGKLVYQFIDPMPLSGANYYRLKMIDKDGSYAYSGIRNVDIDKPTLAIIAYPNPTVDKIFFQDQQRNSIAADQIKTISIYDLKGAVVLKTNTLKSDQGLELNPLPTGIYVLKLEQTDGTLSTHKVMVRK